jgi:hypothetical protein
MEPGKTTLTAGLLRAGFGYLTDEAIAIDPASLVITPFPKPLSVDAGSWGVLADLEPEVDDAVAPYLREQWHVSATDVPAGRLGRPGAPAVVITPHYEPDGETRLTEVGRAEMLRRLMGLTFGFRSDARRATEVLARVLGGAACYDLAVHGLDDACDAVGRVVARIGAEESGG